MKFRKRLIVEAVQFQAGKTLDSKFIGTGDRVIYTEEGNVIIETLAGAQRGHRPMLARPGDWIIRDVRGGLYSMKSEIFEASYEAVEEEK